MQENNWSMWIHMSPYELHGPNESDGINGPNGPNEPNGPNQPHGTQHGPMRPMRPMGPGPVLWSSKPQQEHTLEKNDMSHITKVNYWYSPPGG